MCVFIQHDAVEGAPLEVVARPVLLYNTKQQKNVITYDVV